MQRTLIIAALGLAAGAATLGAQKPEYKRHVPPALAKQAKVPESAAADSARTLVPGARIQELELEREGGRLIYSFDMMTPGKDGIDEVNIDAKTGRQVGKVEHESSAAERREAAAEKAKAKKSGSAAGAKVKRDSSGTRGG